MITYHTENYNDNWGDMLACPKCKDHYVHFRRPRYIKSGDVSGVAWEGRGDAIKLELYCEQGHDWTIRLGHHKGQTYLKVEDIKDGIIG